MASKRAKRPPTGRPPGQPSPIDTVVGWRDVVDETGTPTGERQPITVADRIVNAMRAGSYFEPACNAAGVSKETGYQWQRVAGRVKLRARGEPLDTIDTTEHERRCAEFSDAVAEAESSWEVGALAALQRLAQGGTVTTRTVTKRGPDLENGDAGPILDITTTTETLLPDKQVLEWRLERRFPHRYQRRLELTGADGGPVALTIDEDDRVEALAETLEAYLQGVEDAKPKRRRKPKLAVVNTDGQDEPGPARA